MDSNTIKKEDKRITVTFVLCIAALVFYALLTSAELHNTVLFSQISGYLEQNPRDYYEILTFYFSQIVQYVSLILFFIVLINGNSRNRPKLIGILFFFVMLISLCFNAGSLLALFILYQQPLGPIFRVYRILGCVINFLLFVISWLLYKKVKKQNFTLLLSRFLFFTFLIVSIIRIGIWIYDYLIDSIAFLEFLDLLHLIEMIVVIFPAYIVYKALIDEKFYQRFIVQFPQKPYHPQKLTIFSDK